MRNFAFSGRWVPFSKHQHWVGVSKIETIFTGDKVIRNSILITLTIVYCLLADQSPRAIVTMPTSMPVPSAVPKLAAPDFPPNNSVMFQSKRANELFARLLKNVGNQSPKVELRFWSSVTPEKKFIPAAYTVSDKTIWVSAQLLNESDELLTFLIAHEYGHAALHNNPLVQKSPQKKELEADLYAVMRIKKSSLDVAASVDAFCAFSRMQEEGSRAAGGDPGKFDSDHPSANVRCDAMKRLMRILR